MLRQRDEINRLFAELEIQKKEEVKKPVAFHKLVANRKIQQKMIKNKREGLAAGIMDIEALHAGS